MSWLDTGGVELTGAWLPESVERAWRERGESVERAWRERGESVERAWMAFVE
jgi:hypothetical protein